MKLVLHDKKYLFGTIALVLLAVAIALLSARASFAQAQSVSTRNLTIVPPTVTLDMQPGSRKEGVVKLINDSSDSLNLHVDTQDFIVTDNNGVPSLLPPNTYSKKYSAAAWVGVAPSTFTIAPHQKAELTYYVQVPSDARPGGHYTALIFKPASAASGTDTGASVQTDIGTLFSVHVAGPIVEKATVDSFSTTSFQEYGPFSLTTKIHNLGDSDITPQGTITYYNIFGQKVASQYLPEHRIFPEAVRNFENSFGGHWMIGKYTAKFLASYGAKNNLPLVAEVSFIVFPWKVAVVVLLIIVVAVLGYLVWKKRKGKNDPPTQQVLESPSDAKEHVQTQTNQSSF